jgi:hypothetical protein
MWARGRFGAACPARHKKQHLLLVIVHAVAVSWISAGHCVVLREWGILDGETRIDSGSGGGCAGV